MPKPDEASMMIYALAANTQPERKSVLLCASDGAADAVFKRMVRIVDRDPEMSARFKVIHARRTIKYIRLGSEVRVVLPESKISGLGGSPIITDAFASS